MSVNQLNLSALLSMVVLNSRNGYVFNFVLPKPTLQCDLAIKSYLNCCNITVPLLKHSEKSKGFDLQ